MAEPGRNWHAELKNNRKARIDTRCVWRTSGEVLKFNETPQGELSTLDAFSDKDRHSHLRTNGTLYDVETVSLEDLLEHNNAPPIIDYLSIDTEGSEFEILRNHNFDRFTFRTITCEHNRTPLRKDIYDLLTSKGYSRKFERLSKFDDWYILGAGR